MKIWQMTEVAESYRHILKIRQKFVLFRYGKKFLSNQEHHQNGKLLK